MKIISFLLFLIIILYVLQFQLKPFCYNFWNGYSATINYEYILNKVKPNSSILDVGVGTGTSLLNHKKLILEKNLYIHGIDIDEEYNNYCKKEVQKHKLESNIFIEYKDLFELNDKKYDYIIFIQSFPVIERDLMTKILLHAQNLLNNDGKIIFTHNLVENKKDMNNIFYKIKPYIKYIPLVWIDSGKPTLKTDFEDWLKKYKMTFTYDIIHTINKFNIDINTYTYICEKNKRV